MRKIKFMISMYLDVLSTRSHSKQATTALANIEKYKGPLSRDILDSCDNYALEVLGSKKYAPWLYVYSAVAGEFKEGWIPDNYYQNYVIPQLKGKYGDAMNLKAMPKVLFNSNKFPDLAYFVNDIFCDRNYSPITETNISETIFKDNEKVVFKIDDSGRGKGVHIYDKSNFNIKEIKKLGNGVFQSFIYQHDFFENLMPKSVSTLRLTTVTDNNGTASLRACMLRLARVNDTHVLFDSNIMIPVDVVSGELFSKGFLPTWETIEKHPDTGIYFKDKVIPNWDKCREAAIELHEKLPFVRCLGWDMVVDNENKVQIMEVNGNHNDIKFHEATQGPCFSDLGWERVWK